MTDEPAHMYERVAGVFREKIILGELQAGTRLPTQAQISDEFHVSRAVARTALDLLESEGLIDRVQGGRAAVRQHKALLRRSDQHYRPEPGAPFAEESIATERVPRYSHRTYPDRAGPEIAQRLKIQVGDPVMRTIYTSYADDQPLMIVDSFEPVAITRGTGIERPEEGSLMGAGLVDRFTSIGLRPTAVVERIRSRMPRPSEAEQLELRPGAPVTVIVRITYAGDRPVETADLLLAADQYELEYTVTVPPPPASGN
jgi:DNA-binding GntR family transcriptional regulator